MLSTNLTRWNISKINAACRRPQAEKLSVEPPRARESKPQVVFPKLRPPTTLKRQAERPPPKTGCAVVKPTSLTQTTLPRMAVTTHNTPSTSSGAPLLDPSINSAMLLPRHDATFYATTKVSRPSETTLDCQSQVSSPVLSDLDLQQTENTHILTDSPETCSRALAEPQIKTRPFPQSFSSPIQEPVLGFYPRSQAISIPNSSPARLTHDAFPRNLGPRHFNPLQKNSTSSSVIPPRRPLAQTLVPLKLPGFPRPLSTFAATTSQSPAQLKCQNPQSHLQGMLSRSPEVALRFAVFHLRAPHQGI